MSVKKNLTVATLAALLAVPTFNATSNIHIPNLPNIHTTLDAKADSTVSLPSNYTGHWSGYSNGNTGRWSVYLGRNSGYMHRYDPGDNEQGPIAYTKNSNGKYSWWPKNAIGQAGAGPASSYFYLLPNGQLAWKEDVGTSYLHRDSSSRQSATTSQQTNDNGNGTNSSVSTSNNNVNNNSNENSTQYTSKSKLPQTGESNNASKSVALSAMALGASAGFMALSLAKKRQQEAGLDTITPTESAVNSSDGDDKSGKENNVDDDMCHKIMSDTFKDISNDIKRMSFENI